MRICGTCIRDLGGSRDLAEEAVCLEESIIVTSSGRLNEGMAENGSSSAGTRSTPTPGPVLAGPGG